MLDLQQENHTMTIPTAVFDRIVAGLRRFRSVLQAAKSRDIGGFDTEPIVADMLAEVFGFDKYVDITREHAARDRSCDLATKVDGELWSLVKVQPIGSALRDEHIRHVVDYATCRGVDWVVLTNGQYWRVFNVSLSTPSVPELVLDLDVLAILPDDEAAIRSLFVFSKEGIERSTLAGLSKRARSRNRFNLAAILLGDAVLETIGSEVRRLSPGVEISAGEIKETLVHEVLKREVIEGDNAAEARRHVVGNARW